ncbi:formate dehydrogenase (plasmid) [Rhodococcus erythropolis R138]|uniref:formate dehydrogenase accessory sulfurtransferase FdhD n=1 Tax=Rhodococcus erythropolis TaxID=1833 RepID=UPI0004927405|nr:formate dehydrogenase accessory sulfurtransferase FdhD [Rhodococcus erythropolis]ALU73479.1 formate dehydrogenase [Rhodococcus erythropolis R138]
MGRITTRRSIVRVRGGHTTSRPDTLVVEEPLEIRVNGSPLAVTMRTPGHDVELAHGFLLTEGVINSADDVTAARYCEGLDDDGLNTYNVLDVTLAEGVPPPQIGVERNFYTTSSCGVCGKASLDAVRVKTSHSPADDQVTIDVHTLATLPDQLRTAQKVFDATGGLHAAALFDSSGRLLVLREDVGRHNAVDKVIGWATAAYRIPLAGIILMVSGRASFELVQKAVMAGIPILSAVSAPSSLAVDLASETGLTLIGFLRGTNMNLYTHDHRVRPESVEPTRE